MSTSATSSERQPEHPEHPADPRTGQPRPSRNPASAVYGTVLAGSLIAVEGARDDVDVLQLVAVVLVTQCVYWLAHTYSELVGGRISTGQRPRRGQVSHLLAEEWPLVSASFEPLAVLVIARALGASADAAVLAALWAGALMLAGWALLAGRRARLRRPELLLYVVLSAGFGAVLVLLKAVLH